jgi:thiamine biosynthesis protein ThiS
MTISITLNGTAKDVPDTTTILTLLADAKLSPQKVAVELNKRLLRTERYNDALKPGDEVEIVTFVGGG